MDFHTATKMCVKLLELTNITPDRFLARTFGTIVFECPVVFSGFVSKNVIDPYGFRVDKVTYEHFISRQKHGLNILNYHRESPVTEERMLELLKYGSQIHYVTSEENTRLAPIQNNLATRDLEWQQQYKLAGIELIPDPGRPPLYFYWKYVIGDTLWPNVAEAAKANDLTHEELLKRVRSTAKKWADYKCIKPPSPKKK